MATFSTQNRDLSCYLVTKHSWKGKYPRVFSVGTHAITTYNPKSLEITNQWLYDEFVSIRPTQRQPNSDPKQGDEFVIIIRKKGKSDNMRFSSEFAQEIIAQALVFQNKFSERPAANTRYSCVKYGWSSERQPCILEIGPDGVHQLDKTGLTTQTYPYNHIKHVYRVVDCPGGFVLEVGAQMRRHCFANEDAQKLIQEFRANASECVGVYIPLAKEELTFDAFTQTRLGLCSKDEQLTSYAEFKVQKLTRKSEHAPARRLMCMSETCIIERDPASYMVICARSLKEIICLVRETADPQRFQIEYENGDCRTYMSNERNYNVFVASRRYERNMRLLPYNQQLDEESELQLMRHIINVTPGLKRSDMIRRFNANVPYNGLTHSAPTDSFFSDNNKNKCIVDAILTVLAETYTDADADGVLKTESQLACLHRLFASKSGFQAFTAVSGVREKLGALVVTVLKRKQEAIDYACVEMLCSLMQPMHADYELRLEQLNKQSLLSSRQFVEHLLDLIVEHVSRSTGALVIASMLDFLTYTVCYPYSETTSGEVFDMIIELVAERGRAFCRLFHNPSMTIVKGAGMVMRAIIEESSREISKQMQVLSLTEGAFLRHLQLALLMSGKDLRVLTNRQLSGLLITLWVADSSAAMELLRRCLPRGLLDYLDSSEKPPQSERDLLVTRNNLEMASAESRTSALQAQLKSMQYTVEAKLETFFQHWNLGQTLNKREQVSGAKPPPSRLFVNRQARNVSPLLLPPPPPLASRQPILGRVLGRFSNASRLKERQNNSRPVVLRKRRRQIKASANWRMFAYQFAQDHAKADLIWNEKTREEFRQAVESEMRLLEQELELIQKDEITVSWNHTEFYITYPSIQEEIKIGDYYLRFLLNEDAEGATPIHDPRHFFNNVYHRFLLSTRTDMKCLCLRAMGIAYERHFMTIGSFADSKFVVQMLKQCTNIMERDHLVFLISKLALDKNNARELIAEGILPILVDLALLGHLHTNRAKIHTQVNAIEVGATSADRESKEWYYNDKEGARQGPLSFQEMKDLYKEGKVFEKTEIWAEGLDRWQCLSTVAQFRWTICCKDASASTAAAAAQPSSGAVMTSALYNLTELSVVVLNSLIQMCAFFPSREQTSGAIIRPMPRIKKALSDPQLLYQLVQLLLTYEPSIVHRVATLVLDVMQDSPYISRLYLSGVYFFLLMYNGSNILPLARLLHYTHLKQAFRSTLASPDVRAHSVLSPILPEATIYYLEEYGPEKYAEVFLGEFETPEIIWQSSMRTHMIRNIATHIADFSNRLTSNIKALYNFCPIAPIEYPQLEGELFVHYYYLRHLCDESRFADWELREPVVFLRCCLAAWKEEIERKPSTMSIDEACTTLGLDPTDTKWQEESIVKRAYRKLALQYHPDKNANGEDMFRQINYAYEFLTSKLAREKCQTDPDVNRITLILRTQSIIYSRNLEELAPFKYAGYTELIRTIDLEADDTHLFGDGKLQSGTLLSAAVELCYWTLRSSALNAEQLRREAGLEALYKTFQRCEPMVTAGSKETDMPVQVCVHVCNCWATAGLFEACRERLSSMNAIFVNLCHLLRYEHLPRLACAASECVSSFSACSLLQTLLFQAGVIWHLMPHLFRFDYTLDEGGVQHNEETNRQAVSNRLARSSIEALANLGGYRQGTPPNDGVQNSLRAMLTQFVCRLMEAGESDRVLRTLNSNTESPYIIWDNGTRAELIEFVERHATSTENTSELFGAEFQLSVYAKELIIGEIFVRIYNEQPEFTLDNPKQVVVDLLEYLARHIGTLSGVPQGGAQKNGAPAKIAPPPISAKPTKVKKPNNALIDFENSDDDERPARKGRGDEPPSVDWGVKPTAAAAAAPASAAAPQPALSTSKAPSTRESAADIPLSERVEMALAALNNVLKHNPGMEYQLLGRFPLIFGYLRLNALRPVQLKTLSVISKAANNKECVADLSTNGFQLPIILILLVQFKDSTEVILQILIALVSNGQIVKSLLDCGGLLYVLHVLCAHRDERPDSSRQLAAELLAKLQTDKLTGPRWSRFITRYLPPIFADTLRDSPSSAIQMFDSTTENPELIWNDDIRLKVRALVAQQLQELLVAQSRDPSVRWAASTQPQSGAATGAETTAYSTVIAGELIVGGVFIRLFNQNPQWTVRHPKQFATELMEAVLELMQKPNANLVPVASALVSLIIYNQSTADQIPAQGYLSQFVRAMHSKSADSSRAALLILQQLSENSYCANSLATQPIIRGLQVCMRQQPELIKEAAHALKHLTKYCTAELAEQFLNTDIIAILLKALSDDLTGTGNVSAAKAEIVEALKSVSRDLVHGDRISEILKNSPVWAQYKDQRHDLFLPASRTQAITAGSSSAGAAAGFLTQGMFEPPPRATEPPPRASNAPPPSSD